MQSRNQVTEREGQPLNENYFLILWVSLETVKLSSLKPKRFIHKYIYIHNSIEPFLLSLIVFPLSYLDFSVFAVLFAASDSI